MAYLTILTDVGQAKISSAIALGTTVQLSTVAVGDGNGADIVPDPTMIALVNQVWSGDITSSDVDPVNSNWIIVESYLTPEVGNFFVREIGIFDIDGDLIAIGNYPETYKPIITNGIAKDLYIKFVMEVSNSSAVSLLIDPAVVLATRAYVDGYAQPKKTYVQIVTNYLAKANDFIYVDTLSLTALTVTLPATPSANDTVEFVDERGSFDTAALTLARNGETIMGLAEDMVVDVKNISFGVIYNGTDWRLI